MKEKEIEIHGCFTVPEDLSVDTLSHSFIDWVEANRWLFGGGFRELSAEESGYMDAAERKELKKC